MIILLVLILLGIGGYFVYTEFIAKEKPKENNNPNTISPPTPSSSQDQENNNSSDNEKENNSKEDKEQSENNIVGLTYKTKDGKRTFKILEKNGAGYSEEYENGDIYLAEYNGQKLYIYQYENHDKYNVFIGDKVDNSSQCGEYYLVVNNQTQELLNLEYGNSMGYYIEKMDNNYYFVKRMCAGIKSVVYNEDLNKIADDFIISSNNVFYAMKDGYITKFDSDGKVLKQSSFKPDYKDNELMIDGKYIIDNNFYLLTEINSQMYLYDFDKDTKMELNNPYKVSLCPIDNCDSIAQMIKLEKKLLIILFAPDDQESSPQVNVTYLFNPTNNKLESIGNFLSFDSEEFGKGNMFLYDDTFLYKYDNSGNLVTKIEFDYSQVYDTAAYNGDFFAAIKENGDYFIQNVFSKDKYKIDMVDGYKFDQMYVSSNIINILLTENNGNGHISYEFNIDTKTMSK